MQRAMVEQLGEFLDVLCLADEPVGVYYSDHIPESHIMPKEIEPPTVERERKGEIDWKQVFANFSCVIGAVWRARKKKVAACFSATRPGCPGGSFYLGFHKPQTEAIIGYVSSGVEGWTEGERYCESPEALRKIFAYTDPAPAEKSYVVIKPLSLFTAAEKPLVVTFFTRPEPLCGLHQLATFVTNDPEVVMSPWSAACGAFTAWPLHYQSKGLHKAVLGGWDPSARKFFPADELLFSVPCTMFELMLLRYRESFLLTPTWQQVAKKAGRSQRRWSLEG